VSRSVVRQLIVILTAFQTGMTIVTAGRVTPVHRRSGPSL
jgi:hypothetical protein